MENNNRLNAKDLINVGIYTTICAVLCTAVAMTGVIPIMMVLLVVCFSTDNITRLLMKTSPGSPVCRGSFFKVK